MKRIALLFALLLSACPVTVIDAPTCRRCSSACDEGLSACDDCRSENCPDMDDADE